jgi:uncharacterized damage-inducible protein DinB
MSEIRHLIDLMDRTWAGDAWHGPSVQKTLEGCTAAEAVERPLANAHNIHELAEHIIVWQEAVRRWLAGEDHKVTPEMDWKKITVADETAWADTRARMESTHAALRAAIAAFPDSRLDEPRGPGKMPWYAVLEATVHHDLYHAGQIAMLRKATRK